MNQSTLMIFLFLLKIIRHEEIRSHSIRFDSIRNFLLVRQGLDSLALCRPTASCTRLARRSTSIRSTVLIWHQSRRRACSLHARSNSAPLVCLCLQTSWTLDQMKPVLFIRGKKLDTTSRQKEVQKSDTNLLATT